MSGKTGKSLWRFRLEGVGATRPLAQVIRLDGRLTVICAAGTRLVGLDLKTGKPVWPAIDLELESIVPPQVADLDYDGVPDLLLVGSGPPNTLSVLALSLATRKPIWKKALYTELGTPDPWNWFWNEHTASAH